MPGTSTSSSNTPAVTSNGVAAFSSNSVRTQASAAAARMPIAVSTSCRSR